MQLNRRSILGAAAIGLGLGTAARLAAQPGPPTRRVAPEARAAASRVASSGSERSHSASRALSTPLRTASSCAASSSAAEPLVQAA